MDSSATPFPRVTRCPGLPAVTQQLGWESMSPYRHAAKDEAFYLAALRYSQSLWQAGKPAQAILQLNKAWSADLVGHEPALKAWPPPYQPLGWMLQHGASHGFIGNPVRHFQHLATRMSGPRQSIREWRAWACFHLAEHLLDPAAFPRDEKQIADEALIIPSFDDIHDHLTTHGWPDEAKLFAGSLAARS